MRITYKQLKEAVHEVAETLGTSLDGPCHLHSEGYELDKYAFHLHCQGVDFELSISGDDLGRSPGPIF